MAETGQTARKSAGSQVPDPGFRPTSQLYRVRVEGTLDPSWSTRLSGLRISMVDDADQGTASVLEGVLADRAALIGVLNALHDLNLTLLSVEALKAGPGRPTNERWTGHGRSELAEGNGDAGKN